MQKPTRRRRYPIARSDLTFRPVGGRYALQNRAGEAAHFLTFTAALVLTYCDGRHDTAAIAAGLAGKVPEAADPTSLHNRVSEILDDFARDGLLA